MRNFLLVAPLTVAADGLPLAEDTQPTTVVPPSAGRMDTQEKFDPGHLTHTYVRHASEPAKYPDTYAYRADGAVVQLDDIRLVVAAEAVLLHASARLDGAKAVLAVEQLLSDAVRDYVRTYIDDDDTDDDVDVTWVNRTLIAPADEVPADWLAPAEETELVILRANGHSPELTVGWGNNALSTDDGLATIRTRLLEGLVDAQVLWLQLDRIAQRSAELIRAYRAPGAKGRHVAHEQVDDIAKALAAHNLYYDEVLLNLQGNRKQVAVATLRSWGYATLLDRVTRRVGEIERVAQQEAEIRRRSYQGIVEAVLLALGLVSLLQLLLALAQLAFSGPVDAVPGQREGFSIMEFLRRIDLDVAIWLTSAATVLAFVGIVLLKRRR